MGCDEMGDNPTVNIGTPRGNDAICEVLLYCEFRFNPEIKTGTFELVRL